MLSQLKRDAVRLNDVINRLGLRYAIRRSIDALVTRTIGRARHPADKCAMLSIERAEDRFTKIYTHNYWKNGESRSGAGSTLDAADLFTKEYLEFIRMNGVRSIFDAPCGDWNWMQNLELPADCVYIGGDIVKPLIGDLNGRFATEKISFIHFDICSDVFPDAEIWLCRDCLFHLSFEDIAKAFEKFARSKCEFALITSHYQHQHNLDIPTGDFRFLNLSAAPFFLPDPKNCLQESVVNEVRIVGIWSRDEIASAINRYRECLDADAA